MNPVYLDCNATTPLDPQVREVLVRYLTDEFGNEGSRTHEYGARAKQAVQRARDQVGAVVGVKRDEVIFTSGATESNNLAILGLREAGHATGRKHLITTAIEHKAVLEPFEALERDGFEVTRLAVGAGGYVEPDALKAALRDDTLLVSIMQANNETGVLQPLKELASALDGHPAYLHTDAAQGFGKDLESLRDPRIDMISVSGHKVFAPKGVGALITRRRGYERVPLKPLVYGGGQERGLRPGTLPVALIAALGEAAELAVCDNSARLARCKAIREVALGAFRGLSFKLTGEQTRVMSHVLNVSFRGLDSEALIVALKDLIAISNGSACTSASYTPSHVLKAMGMTDDQANACVRISWCHMTPDVDWGAVAERIRMLS
ncbi:cysteine desulfurase [Thauera linaloolentis 47Lol = DSM 12138]|uniref:cysteine desulfurase n=1 Tax=Thauera linaloolentis (strain DSM 12138 / JCM 21573 / CCUG 41526 / CIP 105981 / IAM 15112 / NBRC 102519 / 47Lol) TaxID=1123367 RepID=N6Z8G3_THAL4|nr:cysteine desulfurase DndA [Thauera linaloolentis]ENO88414.1 cysteine desulfurase [Thauera linaloolentis 47Lol = DSM 12138]